MLALDVRTTYRTATRSDLESLLKLVQEFHQLEQLAFDPDLDRTALEQLLSDPALGQIWLIQQSNTILGYVIVTFGYSVEFRGREASIEELYLRPDYRKLGIGTQTLQFLESIYRSRNFTCLSLEVSAHNHSAQRVYRKAGFDDRGYRLMTKSCCV